MGISRTKALTQRGITHDRYLRQVLDACAYMKVHVLGIREYQRGLHIESNGSFELLAGRMMKPDKDGLRTPRSLEPSCMGAGDGSRQTLSIIHCGELTRPGSGCLYELQI